MSLIARRPSDADNTADGGQPPAKRAKSAKAPKSPKETREATAPHAAKGRGAPEQSTQEPTTRQKSAVNKRSGIAAVSQDGLLVGAEPRVDLLPPEVRVERRNKRTRRAFGWGVLAVLLVVLIAAGGAFSLNVMSQAQLLVAHSQTESILVQQQKYAPVREVQKEVALAQAAQAAGASTEIDWKAFLDRVGAAQPNGLTLDSVAVDSISPIALYQQSTDPLQGPRIGTVTVVGKSAALPDVPAWVAALQKIPGVVDVVPGTVTLDEVSNAYKSTVTIHVSDKLYTKRFAPKGQ